MGRLDGKILVVTGGAGFLGQQYMKAIKREGGIPISLDRRPSCTDSITCDITKLADVDYVAENIRKMVGPVTGLVNNAAINPTMKGWEAESGALATLDPIALQRAWSVEILGAIHCCQVFGEAMARRGEGSIVNISSELGLVAPNQTLYKGQFKPLAYSLTKHAMIGLTRWLATYWAGKVRVNAFAPGGMENGQSADFIKRRSKLIPMGRMSRPGEYDGAITFLLSDESSYMTGAVLSCDGGYTCW